MQIEERKIYFAKSEFYQIIKEVGGVWNDTKERPIVCLLKIDNTDIFWAIPIGNYNHRNEKAKERIEKYLKKDKRDLRSCYYHLGNTNEKSIFFISDVIPITSKYILREYLIGNSVGYEIKNTPLINELSRKLRRILKFEENSPNFFRQHITDLKNYLQDKK